MTSLPDLLSVADEPPAAAMRNANPFADPVRFRADRCKLKALAHTRRLGAMGCPVSDLAGPANARGANRAASLTRGRGVLIGW